MDFLGYKTFVWPQNPHTYREVATRTPEYYTQDGEVYFEGMSALKRTITGSGVFYGADAYTQYLKLQKLAEEVNAGNLEHPIFGIRYCYLTMLEVTQEPKENYVSYRFEFTQARLNGEIPK
jgi:prophage DNA circulation protein